MAHLIDYVKKTHDPTCDELRKDHSFMKFMSHPLEPDNVDKEEAVTFLRRVFKETARIPAPGQEQYSTSEECDIAFVEASGISWG
jgi:hypothetical protein